MDRWIVTYGDSSKTFDLMLEAIHFEECVRTQCPNVTLRKVVGAMAFFKNELKKLGIDKQCPTPK